ncbi:MAG: hypothetical protein M9962_08455 [Oligoflexia bacterium]|nr:hypothetical protein [Oligoflexia bacterium]
MMKQIFFLFTLSIFSATTFADDQMQKQYNNLRAAVKEQCDIPDHMNNYSANAYSRYLAQIFIPELKMLNTAFLNGFSITSSANIGRGSCVIVFMGLANDPKWESRSNFYEKAKQYNRLPSLIFDGFDEEGNLKLKPLGEPVN